MALPTHYTGSDGEIQIGGAPTTLVNFSLDMSVGVINSASIGKRSDMKYAGKFDVSGTITQVLVTGDLMAKMIGAAADITTSSLEALLAATDLDAAAREELLITSDPTHPTSVKATMTVGDVLTTAGSIIIHGTDSSDNYVTEVISFAAMSVGDPAQVLYGSQAFKTTDFVDIEAALESGTAGNYSQIKLDGVSGTKTITPGEPTLFNIIGKVTDGTSYYQMTANNCFFTGGTFPVGDAETLVQTDLPFVMQDPDSDLTLVWTSA
jgi:hypothetical protein